PVVFDGFSGGIRAFVARPIWSGTISFGLVSVPVRMFSATESKELRFHFLHKRNGALNPIGYDRVDKETGESVPDDEIVRGFEFEKGNYVELDDEDLDRLDVELTKARACSRPSITPTGGGSPHSSASSRTSRSVRRRSTWRRRSSRT